MDNKKTVENSELDFILDSIYEDILIADAEGLILRVSKSFESMYGVKREEVIGKTVYQMEEAGLFRPSITAMVLKSGEKVTMRQKNSIHREIVVTAVPIKDNRGDIVKVISFSRDITEFLTLQEQYQQLETKIEKYTAEINDLRERSRSKLSIIAESDSMKKVVDLALKASKYDTNVLVAGESGVGKTLLARFIHENSTRAEESFVEINCGAIPENLIESELFGYEAGSFTGASRKGKMGLIEIAKGGTLFLDEVSELSPNLQVKILKVIQDKTFIKVGGTKETKVDFRLVTATNKDLQEQVDKKLFREDLFYRINVININIPPLRERVEDIIELTRYKMDFFNKKYNSNKTLSPKAYQHFLSYGWPGNIRELENMIERLIITTEPQEIGVELLPAHIVDSGEKERASEGGTLLDALKLCEKQQIEKAYVKHKTTIGVAKELGISQPTASRKIKEHIV